MICLALDTAGPVCAVALARGRGGGIGLLDRRCERIGRGHAERLLPMVGEALQAADLGYSDLTRIAVTVGPGSFTGVRAGVAAARGLALALGVEALGIGTLDALLHAAGKRLSETGERSDDLVVAALAASRGEIFAAARSRRGDAVPACLTTPEELAARLVAHEDRPDARDRPVAVTGSAARPVVEELARRGLKARILDETDHADIAAVAELGADGLGETPPRPLYLRPPDARPQAGARVALLGAAP
jgi:tRNA threonylcarbamoyladenosine biosynthesis protein TsaB